MKLDNTPLSVAELEELDQILLGKTGPTTAMPLDVLDGYLHAIVIGPTTIQPSQWLPGIWGEDGTPPGMKTPEQYERLMGMIFRHYNNIIRGLSQPRPEISPLMPTTIYRAREYLEPTGWALGFLEGMMLCWDDWLPLLDTSKGQKWIRPIGMLTAEGFSPRQEELTRTPARRGKLAEQMCDAVLYMHAYWIPHRMEVAAQAAAALMSPAISTKTGRNEPCPCGSGKKFKKCCGAPDKLH